MVNPSFFPQGDILLNGSDALRYVRERKAFLDGDFERVQNQQRFVNAIAGRILTVETLANPQRIMDVVNGFTPFITVDEGLDAATIAGHAWSMREIRPRDIEMFTVPHGPPATTEGGASIVEQDPEAMERLQEAFRSGTVDTFLSTGDDADSGPSPSGDPTDPVEATTSPSGTASPSPTMGGRSSSPTSSSTTDADPSSTASAEPAPRSVCG